MGIDQRECPGCTHTHLSAPCTPAAGQQPLLRQRQRPAGAPHAARPTCVMPRHASRGLRTPPEPGCCRGRVQAAGASWRCHCRSCQHCAVLYAGNGRDLRRSSGARNEEMLGPQCCCALRTVPHSSLKLRMLCFGIPGGRGTALYTQPVYVNATVSPEQWSLALHMACRLRTRRRRRCVVASSRWHSLVALPVRRVIISSATINWPSWRADNCKNWRGSSVRLPRPGGNLC